MTRCGVARSAELEGEPPARPRLAAQWTTPAAPHSRRCVEASRAPARRPIVHRNQSSKRRIGCLLNTFSAAGVWLETTVEPQMPADVAERYPHKQAVMNKYLGILMFNLRPLPGPTPRAGRQPEAASR